MWSTPITKVASPPLAGADDDLLAPASMCFLASPAFVKRPVDPDDVVDSGGRPSRGRRGAFAERLQRPPVDERISLSVEDRAGQPTQDAVVLLESRWARGCVVRQVVDGDDWMGRCRMRVCESPRASDRAVEVATDTTKSADADGIATGLPLLMR